jgi:hypothetical protein
MVDESERMEQDGSEEIERMPSHKRRIQTKNKHARRQEDRPIESYNNKELSGTCPMMASIFFFFSSKAFSSEVRVDRS